MTNMNTREEKKIQLTTHHQNNPRGTPLQEKIAVLDTYVLRFLASRHRKLRIPPSSPQDHDNYRQLEAIFLGECLKEGIEDIAAADLACWNSKGKTLQ